MTINCTILHTAGNDKCIADALSTMKKYQRVSTTEDNLILYSVDSTTIRPSQDVTYNHINLSGHCATSSPASDHQYHNMPPYRAINFTNVNYRFTKCRSRAKTIGHYHRYPYLDKEDVELTNEDDYRLSRSRTRRCLQMNKLCLLYWRSFLRNTKLNVPISI